MVVTLFVYFLSLMLAVALGWAAHARSVSRRTYRMVPPEPPASVEPVPPPRPPEPAPGALKDSPYVHVDFVTAQGQHLGSQRMLKQARKPSITLRVSRKGAVRQFVAASQINGRWIYRCVGTEREV